MTVQPRFDLHNKYRIVGELLEGRSGSVLDIGARDAILRQHLKGTFDYKSADVAPGCDWQINLEQKLDFPDGAFDYVVALDVLEHLENPHEAFIELSRISKQGLVIALPCMSSWPRRMHFLLDGKLKTDKYALGAHHPGDRHRWLTVYPDILAFYEGMAAQTHRPVSALVGQLYPGWQGALGVPLVSMGLGGALFTDRVIALFGARTES